MILASTLVQTDWLIFAYENCISSAAKWIPALIIAVIATGIIFTLIAFLWAKLWNKSYSYLGNAGLILSGSIMFLLATGAFFGLQGLVDSWGYKSALSDSIKEITTTSSPNLSENAALQEFIRRARASAYGTSDGIPTIDNNLNHAPESSQSTNDPFSQISTSTNTPNTTIINNSGSGETSGAITKSITKEEALTYVETLNLFRIIYSTALILFTIIITIAAYTNIKIVPIATKTKA